MKLVFLHLQKTGGTSLHAGLAAGFAPGAVCPERFDRLHEWPGAELQRYAYYAGHYNFDALDYIAGPKQVLTVLREPRERIISLYLFWTRHSAAWAARNPGSAPALARACADFTAFLASPEPVLRAAIDNEMTCRLAGWAGIGATPGEYLYRGEAIAPAALLARAEANLRRVAFVGTSEALDALHARIAAARGLPRDPAPLPWLNTRDEAGDALDPPRELEITAAGAALLERLTWMDARLHALARELAA